MQETIFGGISHKCFIFHKTFSKAKKNFLNADADTNADAENDIEILGRNISKKSLRIKRRRKCSKKRNKKSFTTKSFAC